jgi:RNA polymerase sigma factor (sigma-70 family)
LQQFSSHTDETILWQAFAEGREEAFSVLFHTYYKVLYNYGKKFSADPAFVEDCIQELFGHLWKSRRNLNTPQSVKNYLLKAFRRHIQRRTARQGRLSFLSLKSSYHFSFVFSPEHLLLDEQTAREQQAKLAAIVNKLSKRQREAIYLKFYNELDYEAIASVMSISYQSARNLVHEAVKVLRKHALPLMSLSCLINSW